MKTIVIPVLVLLIFSLISIPDSFAENSKSKARFWGSHEMKFHGEPEIDFRVDPLTPRIFSVDADVKVGNYKTKMYGGGSLKPDYFYYDKQCKSLKGYEALYSFNGDYVKINFKGKVCYMGSNIKSVNLIFSGSEGKGVFKDAVIEGTLSGNSDKYEMLYGLSITSVLVYNNTN